MSNNGGSLTGEPELLELVPTETSLSLSKREELTQDTTTMLLLSTDTLETCIKRPDGSQAQEELLEISLEDALMSMVDQTLTIDTFNGTSATMVKTKVGSLTEKDGIIQSSHLDLESDSKSSQEWLLTELSTGIDTSDQANSILESETTSQQTEDNGSYGMVEPTPSELGKREAMLLPTDLDTNSELDNMLPLDHTETITTQESDGTMDVTETSKTMEESALMSKADQTLTVDTLSSTTVTTIQIKVGSSTKLEKDKLVNHLMTESDSKSDQECQVEELLLLLSISVDTNTD
jgi:hypothetical protein